jgi:Putative Ig domain
MSRRAQIYLSYFFLAAACLWGVGCNGCSGAPKDFDQVSVSTSTPTILQGGTAMITATVADDANGAGVSWTLSGLGTLSNPTKTTVTYTAPASVSAATEVTVHAASVDSPSKTGTVQITVEPPVSVTTTSLPSGNYGSPYSATINAAGGVAPFSWSITSGSLTNGLSLGASTGDSVTISGTPKIEANSSFTIQVKDSTGGAASRALTIAIGPPLPLVVATTSLPGASLNATYSQTLEASGGVPPFSWQLTAGQLPPGLVLGSDGSISGTPTSGGTFSFTVEVSDSENPAKTATANLSISVNNLSALNGNYAFEFNGFTSTNAAISVAGSFTADGQGNLTNGVQDVNAIGATPKNQTFSGSYTIGSNNQGVLTFSSITPSPSYAFSINSTGGHGRLVEFDSSATEGSGDLELRSVNTCTAATFSGNYAFGLTGQQIAVTGVSSAGPDVIVGSFTASAAVSPSKQASIGPGELDANTPVRVTTQDQTVTGSYAASPQSTRCTMTLSSTVQTGMNFSVYPVSASESFMVETDAVSASEPLLTAGTLEEQFGAPFSSQAGITFTGNSVAALSGREPASNTYLPDVGLIEIAGTGSSSFTLNAIENQAGNVIQYQPLGGNFQLADQYGRVESGLVTPFGLVFYMINQNTAFCIGENLAPSSLPYPFFGILQPQSTGPFPATSIASTFVVGTAAPTEASVPDLAGTVQLVSSDAANGDFGGFEYLTTSKAETASTSVAGKYTVTSSTAGAGTLSFTLPATATGAYLIVSPSEVLMISTTAGDTSPVVEIFEQ